MLTGPGDWLPVVDIKEEKERFVLHADLPGVERDHSDITMADGVLEATIPKRQAVQPRRIEVGA